MQLQSAKRSSVFEFLQKSDIVNCQHSLTDLMCISYAQKAALWQNYGRREMCSLNSQIMLHLNTLTLGVYRNGETECLALCHLANMHADQGDYERADGIFDATSPRFPAHSHSSAVWMLHKQRLRFARSVHRAHWSAASQAIDAMATVNSIEAGYCRCKLLKEKGELSAAFSLIQSLLSRHEQPANGQQQLELYARLLLLQSELYCASDNYPCATQPLLNCITHCKQYHFSYLTALATMALAFVQFSLGMPCQALSLIETVLVPIRSYRSVFDQARSQYLWVKCRVAAASNPHDKQTALYNGVPALHEVIEWFKVVEDHSRMKDAIYYQAQLYNELGYVNERNECALRFEKLDKQYPTTPGTVFMSF